MLPNEQINLIGKDYLNRGRVLGVDWKKCTVIVAVIIWSKIIKKHLCNNWSTKYHQKEPNGGAKKIIIVDVGVVKAWSKI